MRNRSPMLVALALAGVIAVAARGAPASALPFTATDTPVALLSPGTMRTSADVIHLRDLLLVTRVDSAQLGTLWLVLETNGNLDVFGQGRVWGDFTVHSANPMTSPESVIGSGSWFGEREYLGDESWVTSIRVVCRLDNGLQMRADETIYSWSMFPVPYFGQVEGVVWLPGEN